MITAERYHDISMGHRVVGHTRKCRHLHGHNYRIFFRCSAPETDNLGMVIDFGLIKELLCNWVESQWDHKLMLWEKDPLLSELRTLTPEDIVSVPFNPTAENIARYLTEVIGPKMLRGTDIKLFSCRVEETYKCAAEYTLTSD